MPDPVPVHLGKNALLDRNFLAHIVLLIQHAQDLAALVRHIHRDVSCIAQERDLGHRIAVGGFVAGVDGAVVGGFPVAQRDQLRDKAHVDHGVEPRLTVNRRLLLVERVIHHLHAAPVAVEAHIRQAQRIPAAGERLEAEEALNKAVGIAGSGDGHAQRCARTGLHGDRVRAEADGGSARPLGRDAVEKLFAAVVVQLHRNGAAAAHFAKRDIGLAVHRGGGGIFKRCGKIRGAGALRAWRIQRAVFIRHRAGGVHQRRLDIRRGILHIRPPLVELLDHQRRHTGDVRARHGRAGHRLIAVAADGGPYIAAHRRHVRLECKIGGGAAGAEVGHAAKRQRKRNGRSVKGDARAG